MKSQRTIESALKWALPWALKGAFPVLVAIATFSCKKGTETVISGEISAPQLGLKMDAEGDFDRLGLSGKAAENLAEIYLRQGGLDYGVFRFENTGREALSIYPEIQIGPDEPVMELHARLFGIFRRNQSTREIPTVSVITDYHSRFLLESASLVFASGVEEKLELNPDILHMPGSRFFRIRPGEGFLLRYRLVLKPSMPIHRSLPIPGNVVTTGPLPAFMPPEFASMGEGGDRLESWIGWRARLPVLPAFYVYSSKSEEVTRLFIDPAVVEKATRDHLLPRRVSLDRVRGYEATDPIDQHYEGLPFFVP